MASNAAVIQSTHGLFHSSFFSSTNSVAFPLNQCMTLYDRTMDVAVMLMQGTYEPLHRCHQAGSIGPMVGRLLCQ